MKIRSWIKILNKLSEAIIQMFLKQPSQYVSQQKNMSAQ